MSRRPIGRYRHDPASVEDPDPRTVAAAEHVAALVAARFPEARVEHVGSTAVPDLAGKGIVDLMLTYPDGMLAQARDCLDSMGFQRQQFGQPFPEERPMRVGTVEVDGHQYKVHVHVLADSSDEVDRLLTFRNLLRQHPRLAEAYVRRKRELIAAGIVNSPEYAEQKGGFILSVLEGRKPPPPRA